MEPTRSTKERHKKKKRVLKHSPFSKRPEKKKLRTIGKYLRIISKNKCTIGFLTKMDSTPELINIL